MTPASHPSQAQRVDVLETLRKLSRLAAVVRNIDGDELTRFQIEAAHDAVAELIEATNAPAVAYACMDHLGVQFVSDDREDCWLESQRDGSTIVELIVRPRAALAGVQPK